MPVILYCVLIFALSFGLFWQLLVQPVRDRLKERGK